MPINKLIQIPLVKIAGLYTLRNVARKGSKYKIAQNIKAYYIMGHNLNLINALFYSSIMM